LQEDSQSGNESPNEDGQTGNISVAVTEVTNDGIVKLSVKFESIQWLTESVNLNDIQYVVKTLKKDFPLLSALTQKSLYDKFMALEA
jgi:hypothetical protein